MERMDVIRFDQVYPGWYFNPSRWNTADGYLPWAVFWLLWYEIPRVIAQRQMDEAGSIALGIGFGLATQPGQAARMEKDFRAENNLDA